MSTAQYPGYPIHSFLHPPRPRHPLLISHKAHKKLEREQKEELVTRSIFLDSLRREQHHFVVFMYCTCYSDRKILKDFENNLNFFRMCENSMERNVPLSHFIPFKTVPRAFHPGLSYKSVPRVGLTLPIRLHFHQAKLALPYFRPSRTPRKPSINNISRTLYALTISHAREQSLSFAAQRRDD